MTEKYITIKNRAGIHARPSSLIVKTAGRFAAQMTITNEAENATVNAKSIIGIMSLGASYNTTLLLRADGPDEEDALRAVAEIFEQRFEKEE
jgi:phosphocarrier protein